MRASTGAWGSTIVTTACPDTVTGAYNYATITSVSARASNKGSRRFYNHGEGPPIRVFSWLKAPILALSHLKHYANQAPRGGALLGAFSIVETDGSFTALLLRHGDLYV